MHHLQGNRLRRYAQVSWQHCGTRGIHYALSGDASKAAPPLHYPTSHQNPTTSTSMDIALHHLHLHTRSLRNSSATLRRTPHSAQQRAPPTHHTYTRYPHWISTPDPNTTPSHHNSVLSHFHILVFSLFRHHELHFWGFSPAATQRRGAPVVAARAMVFGWDEWTMTRTRWLMLLLAHRKWEA
jgi:hypothetical protein